MKLIFEYTKVYILELSRNVSALFFTVLFPAILLQFFGTHDSSDASTQLFTYVIYCNFAVQTVALQKLGISISAERCSAWRLYLKTLPANSFYMLSGRVLSSLFFALISLAMVVVVNGFNHSAHLSYAQQAIVISAALLGGIPMALLAILLGNFLNPAASRGAFVMLNTLLLFGAFSFSIQSAFKEFIPSYQWMMFSTSLISHAGAMIHLWWLLGYTLIFYVLIKVSEKFW